MGSGPQGRGGTKRATAGSLRQVRLSAGKKRPFSQQQLRKLHGEMWASLFDKQGPLIFREEEIVSGCAVLCAVLVSCPSCSDHSPEPLGPGRIIRNMLGWSQMEKTVRSGVWLFRGAFQGESPFSSRRSRRLGQERVEPWCAEGEVPTAENLNLFRGWKSCVGWHCDDEPLFGECGDAKLIVSVSLGNSAVFSWRRQSCANDDATCVGLAIVTFLSWMANAMTSSCIVRTLVGNRNGSILHSVGSNSMPLLVLCSRQEWHVVCQRVRKVVLFLLWRTFVFGLAFYVFFFGFFLVSCAYGEFWLC